MTRPLHAITLHPEWSWAIAYIPEPLAKRCENRTWTPSPRQLQPGDWLAIHAGALSCSRNGFVWCDRRSAVADMAWEEQKRLMFSGQIPAQHCRLSSHFTVELGGCFRLDREIMRETTSAIVALARVTGWDQDHHTAWDVPGQWHWRLDDVRVLDEPVPCGGRQKLWRPRPFDAERAIERAGLRYWRQDRDGIDLTGLYGLYDESDAVGVADG